MTRLSGDIGEIYGKLPGPIIKAWQEFSTAIWTEGRIDAPLRVPVLDGALRVEEFALQSSAALLPLARPLRILWIALHRSRAYRRPLRLARVDFLGAYAVGLVLLIATVVTSL